MQNGGITQQYKHNPAETIGRSVGATRKESIQCGDKRESAVTPRCGSSSSTHATREGTGGTHQPFGKKIVGHLDEDVVAETSTNERGNRDRVAQARGHPH